MRHLSTMNGVRCRALEWIVASTPMETIVSERHYRVTSRNPCPSRSFDQMVCKANGYGLVRVSQRRRKSYGGARTAAEVEFGSVTPT